MKYSLEILIPMCGAIWSTSTIEVFKMPTKYILKFLDNHGLLNIYRRPKCLQFQMEA